MPGIAAFNTSIGQPNPSKYGDTIWSYNRSTFFQDRAVFGELTWHATSAWQVTGGVRYFRQTFLDQRGFELLLSADRYAPGIRPIPTEPPPP